jgi:hypothetical protein
MCVKNWDHHCFWLNVCINDSNIKAFNFFKYTFALDTFMNIILILFSNNNHNIIQFFYNFFYKIN